MAKPPLRVLHCPEMVGGHPQQLARAERARGLDSWSVVFRPSKFHYAADEVLWRDRESRLMCEAKRWLMLGRALWHYDIVHFNFGKSLFPEPIFPRPGAAPDWKGRLKNLVAHGLELRDLALLKRAGKGIIVTFQGDDARQEDTLRSFAEWDPQVELGPGYYTPAGDAHKRRRIAAIDKYADVIYSLNPDLLRVLPARAKFLPYANVDPEEWQIPATQVASGQPPVVLHAPTHQGVKGTRYVLEAVSRLRAENVAFRFQLLEGLPRDEAKTRYLQADVLVDQLLLGWYGGLAVELMALGKPVIGFIRAADVAYVPPALGADIPVIQATPATIYTVLKEWLTVRRHELAAQGRRSRAFVEKWHDPRKIAAMVIADYQSIGAIRRAA
jgi:hypothetical protein